MNETTLIIAAVLLLVSVLVSKISDRFGVPTLLLFLALGMAAGSEGIGGIYFDNVALAKFIGIIALVLILFTGGLDTEWSEVRPILKESSLLATLGVFITAVIVGLFASKLLGLNFLEGLLLGSIVSSTDAAAVFSVLRAKGVSLKGRLKPLLELESGSNDPMAIFLTVGLIQLIANPESSLLNLVLLFFQQMIIGAVAGYLAGRVMYFLVNRLKLGYEGLYPVLVLSLVFLAFGLTDAVGGSGFLAVYLAGIVLRQHDFVHRKSILNFYNGLAWIMQIAMFLTLGLLAFPSQVVPVVGVGLLIAACLMFVARPISVFISLIPSALNWREKTFISWVGLRGAAPIVLATFPLLAKTPHADLTFNIIFFVVLASVLLQGTSLSQVAKWLKLDAPIIVKRAYPIEYVPMDGLKSELKELPIPSNSEMIGKAIFELELPKDFLVILIARDNEFMQPSGGTILQDGDTLLALSSKESYAEVVQRLKPAA
ncbi:MAG: potassium/proton antiporter [Anaerolineales bacterium]|nr:potassium/proton antiporter [Anaerolineales bacterium]